MSYRGCCCARGGLGQGDEAPTVLTADIVRLFTGFQATLKRLPSGNAFLADYAMRIQNWFNTTNADMAKRDFRNARIKVNTLQSMVPDFAKRVAEATMSGTKALEEAQAGASPWNQLLNTLGFGGSIYRPESKTADAFEFGGWLMALSAGALGLTLLLAMTRK